MIKSVRQHVSAKRASKTSKIAEIQETFKGAALEELPFLISWYQDDVRVGVRQLVERAKKLIVAHEQEIIRSEQMYALQQQLISDGVKDVVGIDEVGRGSVAGPLTVAAVVLPVEPVILHLKDSKELTPQRREHLSEEIKVHASAVGLAHIPPKEIDRCGMGVCIRTAMRRALEATGLALEREDIAVLIDGVRVGIHPRERAIVKGDATEACIAAASIVAKVVRDRHMIELDSRYPGYDLAHSKGYGSATHIAGIRNLGLSEVHRASFCRNFL